MHPTNIEELIEDATHIGGMIPVFGGLLAGIALRAISSRRWGRLINYLDSIEYDLRSFGSFSDDQEEFVGEILERVIRERSDEKTECYRNILLNGLRSPDFDYDWNIDTVNLVERLTSNHIKVLQVIYDPYKAKVRLGDDNYVPQTVGNMAGLPANDLGLFLLSPFFPNWAGSDLTRIWNGLCDAYVISRGRLTMVNLPPSHEEIGIDLVADTFRNYVTDYGYGFIRYILTAELR